MFDERKFTGWPSGDCKPIIEIDLKPNEIQKKYNIRFIKENDDLDWYEGGHFYDKNLGFVVLMRHQNCQSHGTTVYVDSQLDLKESYKNLLEILELDKKNIIWKSELIKV